MHLIVYTSKYINTGSDINTVLSSISRVAKIYNLEFLITGLLFFHKDCFVQIIEGPKQSLEGLMEVLENDIRHEDIIRLIDEPIDQRSYSDWNMDSFNLSDSQDLNSEKLINISRVYKETLSTRTDLLTRFYKAMLNPVEYSKF